MVVPLTAGCPRQARAKDPFAFTRFNRVYGDRQQSSTSVPFSLKIDSITAFDTKCLNGSHSLSTEAGSIRAISSIHGLRSKRGNCPNLQQEQQRQLRSCSEPNNLACPLRRIIQHSPYSFDILFYLLMLCRGGAPQDLVSSAVK